MYLNNFLSFFGYKLVATNKRVNNDNANVNVNCLADRNNANRPEKPDNPDIPENPDIPDNPDIPVSPDIPAQSGRPR